MQLQITSQSKCKQTTVAFIHRLHRGLNKKFEMISQKCRNFSGNIVSERIGNSVEVVEVQRKANSTALASPDIYGDIWRLKKLNIMVPTVKKKIEIEVILVYVFVLHVTWNESYA